MSTLARSACLIALCLASTASAADYPIGFVWNRYADWSGGDAPGLAWAHGNPDDDNFAPGSQVWTYEIIEGGGPFGASPWYLEAPRLAVWDPVWYQLNGAWAEADNVNPPMLRETFAHNYGTAAEHARVPAVSWRNPTGRPVLVDVSASLYLAWSGSDTQGGTTEAFPTDVDLIVCRLSATRPPLVLHSGTYSKPALNSIAEGVFLPPLSLTSVNVRPNEIILLSFRARDVSTAPRTRWVELYDSTFEIKLMKLGCPGDANANGSVDFADITSVLANFGVPCP